MNTLLLNVLQRLRPRIGWVQFSLGLAAVWCATVAATDSKQNLPIGAFSWASFLGFCLGLLFGRPIARSPSAPGRSARNMAALLVLRRAALIAGAALVILLVGALLLSVAAQALPPMGLILQDVGELLAWLRAAARRTAGWAELPDLRSWQYLGTSLPRLWNALRSAPSDGERGARMIVLTGGVASAWIGALALGAGLAGRRNMFVWSLPMLVAIGFTSILGAGSGAALLIGLGLLFLLTVVVGAHQRERGWEQKGADYSTELRVDALSWGSGVIGLILLLAILLPTTLSNPLAELLWRDVEVPSGIAVLERNIQRPQAQPKVDIGLSKLPVLELGQSLEQPPGTKIILKAHIAQPFQPSPWPRYWRARLLNLYNGRSWTTNARVSHFDSLPISDQPLPDMIVQEIEDLRDDRTLAVGLPDIFGLDIGAQAERLPDGDLVALTEPDPAPRYRVLSRPQEFAALPSVERPPPDMSAYLSLPRGYSQRVLDLAQAIVGGHISSYERALAIESYLRGLPYAYQVQPLPASGDAVEQFLFDMRQGYCTYYASAMAVMARGLGIPSRVAIGYATGEYDQASRAYQVRQSDAHAWPELYIDGRWLPFEPTPIRALPARSQSGELPTPQPTPAPAEQPNNAGPLIWAGVLALVVLLILLGVWLGRPRRPRSLVAQVQARLERGGARAGVPWPPGATLHEYGALLSPHTGEAAGALDEIVELVEQDRYSSRPLRGDQLGRLRQAAEFVLARLPRRADR